MIRSQERCFGGVCTMLIHELALSVLHLPETFWWQLLRGETKNLAHGFYLCTETLHFRFDVLQSPCGVLESRYGGAAGWDGRDDVRDMDDWAYSVVGSLGAS